MQFIDKFNGNFESRLNYFQILSNFSDKILEKVLDSLEIWIPAILNNFNANFAIFSKIFRFSRFSGEYLQKVMIL